MTQSAINVLFPDPDARAAVDEVLAAKLSEALMALQDGPVSPTLDLGAFRAALAAYDFAVPQDMASVGTWVVDSLRDGLVHMNHPRYFGLFNPAPTHPSQCADAIVSAFNPQICVWSHAPAAVEIERHVIDQVARRMGYEADSGGDFTSGGSEANRTATVCALTRAAPEFGRRGAAALAGQPRIYASRESHLAWLKIAHESGIGRDAVALVPTDGKGRLDPDALESLVVQDKRAGHIPVMIAATAGTTNAGVVDPLHDCRAIADRLRLWFHTDAAWGGALIASDLLQPILAGIEQSDSVTIDAHKWFATTMGAGMFLTREPALLADVFAVSTDYMPSNDRAVDLYVTSSQWSRRFLGLRLFMALAVGGWAGYAAHVEQGVALIDRLNAAMMDAGWTVANDSRMAVTCLEPPAGARDVSSTVARVVAENQHWVSMTRFEGRPVVRACVTNGRTDTRDIDALAAALDRACRGAKA